MNSDKVRWYVNRLRSMPRREILHRIREAFEQRKPIRASSGQRLPALAESAAPGSRLLDVWPAFWSPSVAEHCRGRATDALEGTISVFGHSWSTITKAWNLDPVSGYEWPSAQAHKIDYRHSLSVDPKWTWEVNRLLFLIPVAFAVESGEIDRDAGEDLITTTISDWIGRCRPGHGPQWSASIEVAIRSIALTICAQTIQTSSGFREEVAVSIRDHSNWIKRFPSAYSSANNHRIAEIAALLILDSSWEGILGEAERIRLEKELADVSRALFSADGIGLEQSPTYGAFSLEFLALVLFCHSWSCEKSRNRTAKIVAEASYALAQFTNEDGTLIRYGDDDEGKVVSVAVPDGEYSAALIRLALGRLEVRQCGLLTFADGGISLMRYIDAEAETTWVFDHGPLGFGNIAAHGHADTLAVSLRSAGVNWIVDAGTYRYHGDKKWRTYFRSSKAHNGPQLDGLDSSVMTGDFNWDPQKRAQGKLLSSRAEDSQVSIRATHDGYSRQGLGPVSREVERLGPGHYRITDVSDGDHQLSTGFMINPDCRVQETLGGWRLMHPNSTLQIAVSVTGQSSTNTESLREQTAWFSPAFGEKLPAWRLVATADAGISEHQLIFDFKLSRSSHLEA